MELEGVQGFGCSVQIALKVPDLAGLSGYRMLRVGVYIHGPGF